MYSLQAHYDDILQNLPDSHDLKFNSQRDLQDFRERDFDRQLELLKVQALVIIAENLEKQSVSNP